MEITLKSSIVIKPAKPTPTDHICLSECDLDKPTNHVSTVYFYNPPQPFSLASASQTLQTSLSQVLVHFYPLAGRLRLTDNGRVALDCNSAGALFYEAESNAKIEDFKNFVPTQELTSLTPSVSSGVDLNERPLVMVQLTQLSCGGICLGLAISHTMFDGMAASHFVAEWANIARGGSLVNPPFLDRSVLLASIIGPPPPSQTNQYRFGPLPLLMNRSNDQEERKKETTLVVLHLSSTQVQKLKELANEGRASNIRAYSQNEVVAGHIWRCACKARDHNPEQQTELCINVNFRDRMPLPRWYFGNANLKVLLSSTSGELITKPLSYASSKMREAVEMVTSDYVKSALDYVMRYPDLNDLRTSPTMESSRGVFFGNPNMIITSWLRIPLGGTDFGWGKEIYMGPGHLNSDGKCYILPGRGEDGSLCIALRLQVSHVKNFKELFYENISLENVFDAQKLR